MTTPLNNIVANETVLGLQSAPEYFDDPKDQEKIKSILSAIFPKTR